MANLYGNIENCKRKLNMSSDDLSDHTYLVQLQKEVSAYMNDRLRSYVNNPENDIVTNESLNRIANLFIVGFFLTERAPLQRQGRRAGKEMEADFRVARAEFEFNHYLSSIYGGGSGSGPGTGPGLTIYESAFDRINGEGMRGLDDV